jgi:hypothetical protein
MVFIEECSDGLYRLSMAYQLEQNNWMSRYYYHLGVTIPVDTINAPTQELIDEFGGENLYGTGTRKSLRKLSPESSQDWLATRRATPDQAAWHSVCIFTEETAG